MIPILMVCLLASGTPGTPPADPKDPWPSIDWPNQGPGWDRIPNIPPLVVPPPPELPPPPVIPPPTRKYVVGVWNHAEINWIAARYRIYYPWKNRKCRL